MTISDKRQPLTKRKNYARDLGEGVKLTAEISPCVFMHASYPLQITITLHRRRRERLGVAYAVDRTKTASTYTRADVDRLLAAVRVAPCPRCSAPAFDPATVETNRDHLCEECFMRDVQARFDAAVEAEQQEIAARDQIMKGKGMAVRVTGWVHLQAGGDDYQVDWYLDLRPTPEQIRNMLRERGSVVLDDYQIIPL
jgi:hypothetical protein